MENFTYLLNACDRFFINFRTAFTERDTMIFIIVCGIAIGFLIASALSITVRVYSHKLVSALIREKAHDPSSARSFEDLGLKRGLVYRSIFRNNSPLRKYIKYNGTEMYLPEEKTADAAKRFSEEKNPVLTFIIAVVVVIIAAALAIIYIPQFISAYSNIGK